MDRCILCLKKARLNATLNDIDIVQFFKFTSSILKIPNESRNEPSICNSCLKSAKSAVEFVNMITSNSDILQELEPDMETESISGTSNNQTKDILAKIKKTGNIIIKKVPASKSRVFLEPFAADSIKLEPLDDDCFPEYLEDPVNSDDEDWNQGEDSNDSDYQQPRSSRPKKKKSEPKAKKSKAATTIVKEITLDGPTAYTCNKCKIAYPSYEELYQHMKAGTCFDVSLKCDQCDRTFNNRRKYYTHLQSHKIKDTFMCEECSQIYSSQFSLDMHIQAVHRRVLHEEAIFKCPVSNCDARFFTHIDLSEHCKIHAKERIEGERFCEHCGKHCANLRAYRSHLNIHKEKKFICPDCGKAFLTNILMLHHTQVHTGIKAFACPYCPRSYAKRDSLMKHRKEHAAEYPYACANCQKRFVGMRQLKTHTDKEICQNKE